MTILLSKGASSVRLFGLGTSSERTTVVDLMVCFFFVFLVICILVEVMGLSQQEVHMQLGVLQVGLCFHSVLHIGQGLFFLAGGGRYREPRGYTS